MKRLLLLYVVLLPIYPLASTIYLANFPLVTWYTMVIFLISFCLSVMMVLKKRIKGNEIIIFLFIVSFAITVFTSIFQKWNFVKIVTNSALFFLPFFIYAYVYRTKIRFDEIIKASTIGIVAGAILSLMVSFGFLSSGIHTGVIATDSLLYNFNYADCSSGIFGIIIGIYLITSTSRLNRPLGFINLLSGIIIVIFNQSRGYLICAIVILVLMIFFSLKNDTNRIKSFFKICIISFLILLVIVNTSNPIHDYFIRLFLRLQSTNLVEGNLTYRFSEINEYSKLFCENPIFGKGWGLINNDTTISAYTTRYRVHNMYFGVLACTGLSFTPLFIYSLIYYLIKNIKSYIRLYCYEFGVAICCLVSVMILGLANAGFNNSFCIVFMIVVFIIGRDYPNTSSIKENNDNAKV